MTRKKEEIEQMVNEICEYFSEMATEEIKLGKRKNTFRAHPETETEKAAREYSRKILEAASVDGEGGCLLCKG